MYSSYGLRDAKGLPKLEIGRRWAAYLGTCNHRNRGRFDKGATVKCRGEASCSVRAGVLSSVVAGVLSTLPQYWGVDSQVVRLLEGSFQLFLVHGFSSQGVRIH